MLKRAWYLTSDHDYWTGLTGSPRLPQADQLTRTLTDMFAAYSPAHTGTAVETMLRMAAYLSDAVPQGRPAIGTTDQFARLLAGINLLAGYLAQASGRLAYHVDTATGDVLGELTAARRMEATVALARLSRQLEGAAALCKQAHLATRRLDGTVNR